MKALIYTGPERLEFGDRPNPTPQPDEHVVQVASAGICGSDMHAYLGHDERRPSPLILGHEVAGVRVDDGRQVTINPLVTCGACGYCLDGRDNLCPTRQIISMPPRDGGFAEFVSMPERNLVELPEGISTDQAALAEPIACGWHATRLALNIAKDLTIAAVIGGGAIGVGAALSLRAQGVEEVHIFEPNNVRRGFLQSVAGLDARASLDQGDRTYPIVVDAVGYEATRGDASRIVAPGGVIAHIGLGSASGGLDIRRMTLQEITFIGTYAYTSADFLATTHAMFDGRLGALDWTEVRDLSDGAQAFADIRAGRVPAPKIILKP